MLDAGKLRFGERLLNRWDLSAAVASECRYPPNLLPSRTAENVVAANDAAFVEWIANQCEVGLLVPTEDIVWATKSGSSARPATALSIVTRTVYRALVDDAIAGVTLRDRSNEEYRKFEAEVLADDSARYIVFADVAAFYQYVDHRDLEVSIVRANGKADAARAIRALLTEMVGQSFGLPQGPTASDRLSELILMPVERRLARRGLTVARFNDDFRIGVPTWGSANQTIELLQSELRAIGLTLNDQKTFIERRQKYETHLSEVDERTREAFADVGIDLSGPYEMDLEDPATYEELVGSIMELLTKTIGDEARDGLDRVTQERLLATCYGLMGAWGAPAGLAHVVEVMRKWPRFARTLGNYMARILPWDDHPNGEEDGIPFEDSAESDERIEMVAAAEEALATSLAFRLSGWEAAWIFQPLMHRRIVLGTHVRSWLQRVAKSDVPAVVRARAMLALALHGEIPLDTVIHEFDVAHESGRPDLVAAVAELATSGSAPAPKSALAVFDEDALTSAIATYVQQNSSVTDWAWRLR